MEKRNFFQVAAIGTVFPIIADFAVASVVVENPSDMWLYLSTLDMFIGPRTNGNRFNLTHPTNSFTITCANAPTGGAASVVAGGPIVVTTYDGPISDLAGIPYDLIPTLGNLIAAINALGIKIDATNTKLDILNSNLDDLGAAFVNSIVRVNGTITANGGSTTVLAALPAGQQYVVMAWGIVPSMTGLVLGDTRPSSDIVATLFGGNINDQEGIDPDHPTDYHAFWPYGIRRGDNGVLDILASTSDGSLPAIDYTVLYYVR